MKINIKPIRIFVINLKKDTEKKEYMKELCQRYNLHVEFIEAICGSALSKHEIDEIYSSDKSIGTLGRELSRGEIGCALSHKYIFERILKEKVEIAMILEDDIFFDKTLVDILKFKENFEKNWELILLGHHTGYSRDIDTKQSIWYKKQLNSMYKLARPCEKGYGTYGYLITNNGARKLLKYLDTIEKPIDHYTGDSQYINLYIVNPAPIMINEQLSVVYNGMAERKNIKNVQREVSSIKNLLSKFLLKNTFLNSLKNYIKRIVLSLRPLREYK